MDLRFFGCLPRGVSLRLELGHSRAISSRAVAAVSRFSSRVSRDLWLSLEACLRGFPTGLSHKPPWCESILGLKVVAVQGKQVSLEWTETSGGLWEVETGMSGNFLSCSKGVKDPLEVPEVRCDYPRDASVEMGIISPRGENLLDFLELRQVPSTYDGAQRDPLWWPQERSVPMRVARGPLGIALPSMPGPKTLCGVGAGT